ncbi:hypothetical protein B0J13DRAFT_572290 [Dactylonectria estremocensis]|uniref:Uncharacterized protein n=1 Tax=Dactylonectria estremocensis TaxID=1079267 RepID=A0A9P9DA02_9HYPO|nr:hypothetical protein B0J13DRAFT_572290 [Dactylonectria estremocensis]
MALGVTGNAQNRFIQVAVLLHMLDPVRGEPIPHGLDRNPIEIEKREHFLKRKFLDSFTLSSFTGERTYGTFQSFGRQCRWMMGRPAHPH